MRTFKITIAILCFIAGVFGVAYAAMEAMETKNTSLLYSGFIILIGYIILGVAMLDSVKSYHKSKNPEL